MTIASIYIPDVIRVVTIVLASFVLLLLPKAITVYDRPRRTVQLLLGIEMLVIVGVAFIIKRWHHDLLAYGTPIVFIGCGFLAVYIVRALWLDADSPRKRNR